MSGVAVVALALRGSEPDPAAVEARAAEPYAVRVLRAWDARRSRAYARADGAALADLYVAGSRTGAADREVLRGYRDRGLRVTGMRTQVLAARVLDESGRRLVLLVTDVLVDAVAGRRPARPLGAAARQTVHPPRGAGARARFVAGRGGLRGGLTDQRPDVLDLVQPGGAVGRDRARRSRAACTP